MRTAEEAGLLARATFGWVGPLVGLGFKSPVVLDDLWALQGTNAAASLEGAVGACAKARPTWRVLLSVARRRLLTALFFACIYATTQVGPRTRHTHTHAGSSCCRCTYSLAGTWVIGGIVPSSRWFSRVLLGGR
jgi:hypothetical protein